MSRIISRDEVKRHSSEQDCWIVIRGKVYNVTSFLDDHPGGKRTLLSVAGSDATDVFESLHSSSVLQTWAKDLLVGTLGEQRTEQKTVTETKHSGDTFGKFGESDVPFAEPAWYTGLSSPHYKQTHVDFRAKVRDFVNREIEPYCDEWDESGTYPRELHEKAYKAGVYAAIWPTEYGGTPPRDFDVFHDLILVDELSRCGCGGILWAVFFCFGIALPPVLEHGSQYLKDRCCRDVITGKKIMSLAVTEPYVGSDVANLRATARREGDFYIVNGEKKFITSGTRADFFTVAVRTGGEGIRGISLLLMEKGMPGLKVRRQKTQGWWISSTAYLTFENVKVPVKNLIGQENRGFKYIVHNFNHERFVLAAMASRYARVCLAEAIKYARKRKTFGKRLIDHQVIRHKIAVMARHVEATHAWLEHVAFQLNNNAHHNDIGGTIALLKVQSTKVMELCAREASQVLGGASYIRGGIGSKVERLYREVRVNAIGGGSEEIMLDLAMRQSKL